MNKRVLLLGATGTIGRAVAQTLDDLGFGTVCVVRKGSDVPTELAKLEIVTGEPSAAFKRTTFDIVISCIASRSGVPEDAWAVDYKTNSEVLKAAQENGISQFILLSAICVQKPQLAFQHAKLAFEKELRESGLTYSIVRPTAFFKSLSGQIERVKSGKPYLLFGDGELTRCKPISNADLARYIVSCIDDREKHDRVLPIGGPGPAITPLEQGKELFALTGKTPRYRRVPVAIMDVAISALRMAGLFSKRAAAKAEYAKIGRYYATESMLVWDEKAQRYDEAATPEYGSETLSEHYSKAVAKT
ncbi:Divinyl chlorophyllide a 8-vinyl-reductase [Altererythrobacter insulae]|nr:Divinyl chlorophyllide a 8-vinyl-reductase [Altererythrobacter insulae]